jgi:tetratricopeptide (TPR) repeat protein
VSALFVYHRAVRIVGAAMLLLLGATASADEDAAAAQACFNRGMNLYAVEHWDEAIAEFEAGFLKKPLPAFLFNIANAHREAHRPDKAIRYFQQYLDLSPGASDRAEVEQQIAKLRGAQAPPPTVIVAPPVQIEKPAAPKPIYRRPWFWAVVPLVTGALLFTAIYFAVTERYDGPTIYYPFGR